MSPRVQRDDKGHWLAGSSGNPHGRPKVCAIVRSRAQADMVSAYEVLVQVMREAVRDQDRLAAAVRVLQLAGCGFTPDKIATVLAHPEDIPHIVNADRKKLIELVRPVDTSGEHE